MNKNWLIYLIIALIAIISGFKLLIDTMSIYELLTEEETEGNYFKN